MKLDTAVIVLAVTAATFQTGYLLADSSRMPDPGERSISDTSITMQIRSAYELEPSLAATLVSVKTSRGTVRLAGVVDSEEMAARAEDIASRVEGVREVRSHLHIHGNSSAL